MDASAQEALAVALAEGGAEERERAYATIEAAVGGLHGSGKGYAAALAEACARPLVVSILCAPASKIAEKEWLRAALLLSEMAKVDPLAVTAATLRKDNAGTMPFFSIFSAPDTVFAAMLAKDPSGWDRGDAKIVGAGYAVWAPSVVVGCSAVCAAAGLTDMDFIGGIMTQIPFIGASSGDHYAPLVLLCLDLVRTSEVDEQPEGVTMGACFCILHSSMGKPSLAKTVWEAGYLKVFQATLARYNPMERVTRRTFIPTGMLCSCKDVAEMAQAAGVEVIQPLLDAGAVDIAISTMTAYQMLGKPEEASVAVVLWGAVYMLDILLSSPQAQPVVAKLRSAGVDSFRYL